MPDEQTIQYYEGVRLDKEGALETPEKAASSRGWERQVGESETALLLGDISQFRNQVEGIEGWGLSLAAWRPSSF